jgi:hypothetical protein
MDTEVIKLLITPSVQLFLGIGAWFFGWRIARAQIGNQQSDIRIKLFDQRHRVYEAFKAFMSHCAVSDRYSDTELQKFVNGAERHEVLFGPEIHGYYREVTANALAVRGLLEGLPCEDRPVVGGIVGYFRGSTILTDLNSLRRWFVDQHTRDAYRYFTPYLDYSTAGVNRRDIVMMPPSLPDPPLVRRKK